MKWLWNIIKKLLKRKLFWLAVIIIIIIAVFFIKSSSQSGPEYVTEKVTKGDLKQTVSETGTIESASEIDLNFKANGEITQINVKEGDEVKKGDVLAKLDAGVVGIQVRQAQANYDIAVANMNRFLAGASDQDIDVSQEAVSNAQIAYDNAKRDHDALVKKLSSDIKTYEQAVTDARNNLLITLATAITPTDHSMDVVKTILDDGDLRPRYSVENTQYGVNSRNEYERALPKILLAKNKLSDAKASLAEDDIALAVSSVKDALDAVRNTLNYTFLALSASTTSYDFNELDLETYKSNVSREQSTTDGSINSVNSISQAYDNAQLNYDTALNNKDLNIANSQSSLDAALGSLNLAQAQLDLKKAAPRGVDIAWYQAQVDQAKAALDLALINLQDYVITAPTDGTIIFVNYEVGEQIGFGITDITEAAKAVITILGKGEFEIDVDVPESDIIKVAEGDPVDITLDAYGDRVKFTGTVSFIDLAETNIQDVVFYKVKVTLGKTEEVIKPGMTANVDILTDQRKDVLIIPIRALKEDTDGQYYVEVLEGGKPVNKNVEIGLRGDDGIEILSGLKEGEDVITFTRQK